ncbi:MAG TPA: AsmA family protein [Casimicrobiaceae bacterium]|nr:AsmA family protein [Casimicrobiaceae bacterium]
MRTFWTIVAIAGGLVLLLLIGVAIAVWTVDVNQFVAPVQAKVKAATGRDLAIGGGVKLALGLEPKIVFDDVRFGNAPWAKEKELASVKHVEADVALLPLLQRRFEVLRLTLVEPTIALETGADGKVNWDFGAGPPGAAPPVPGAGAASALASFGIGQVEIEKGTVTYRDDASGNVTRVVIDRFAAQARTPASPINAEFKGSVDDVPIALTGNLGPLDALLARRSPYPVTIEGQVAGRKTKLGAKLQFAQDATKLDELAVGLGSSNATGEATVGTGARKKVTLRLSAPSIALADLKLPPRSGPVAAPAATPPAAAKKGWIFSDEPVSFAGLAGSDVDGDITIGELRLDDKQKLTDVHVRFTLKDARFDASELQAKTMGGTVHGSLKVDATHPAEPTLVVNTQASGLDLGQLLAAGGSPRQVKGGRTDVTVNVTTRGVSEREWARNASGNVLAVVGPASVANSKETDTGLGKIAEAVNPLRGRQSETEVKCVVVRLPLHDGIAHVDHSIGAETREIGVLASGTIDLRNETLDLAVTPKTRVALPVDLPQLASLVRVRGSLVSPAVAVDAQAAAATIAQLGATAAAGKGGLAALGSVLAPKAGAAAGGPDPCDVALGKAPPPTAAAAPGAAPAPGAARAPTPQDELNKALGKLLGR